MYAKATEAEENKKFCVCRCVSCTKKGVLNMNSCMLLFCVLFLFIIYTLFLKDQISQPLVLVILLSSSSFHISYCVTILVYAVLYLQCFPSRREKTEEFKPHV